MKNVDKKNTTRIEQYLRKSKAKQQVYWCVEQAQLLLDDESIKINGQLEPLIVYQENDNFILISDIQDYVHSNN